MWQSSFKDEITKKAYVSRVKLLEAALKQRVAPEKWIMMLPREQRAVARDTIVNPLGAAKDVVSHIQRSLGGGGTTYKASDDVVSREAGKLFYQEGYGKYIHGNLETFINRGAKDFMLRPVQRNIKKDDIGRKVNEYIRKSLK
jgi:hypothetical protein